MLVFQSLYSIFPLDGLIRYSEEGGRRGIRICNSLPFLETLCVITLRLIARFPVYSGDTFLISNEMGIKIWKTLGLDLMDI